MGDFVPHEKLQEEVNQDIEGQNLDFNITLEEQQTSDSRSKSNAKQEASAQKQLVPTSQLPDYSKKPTNLDPEASYLSQAAHPIMCLVTFVFKLCSIGMFLITWLFLNMKTLPFIVIVLAASFDFWAVKNLTGRYLVKLRWWSEIQENNKEVWRFESFEDGIAPNSVDSSFFWVSQFSAASFWAIVGFLNILSISPFYFTISMVNFVLVGSNFYGYYKCRGAHQKKMKGMISMIGLKVVSNAL